MCMYLCCHGYLASAPECYEKVVKECIKQLIAILRENHFHPVHRVWNNCCTKQVATSGVIHNYKWFKKQFALLGLKQYRCMIWWLQVTFAVKSYSVCCSMYSVIMLVAKMIAAGTYSEVTGSVLRISAAVAMSQVHGTCMYSVSPAWMCMSRHVAV